MDATSIDDIINYHFRSEALRNEATLAAGASASDVNIHGLVQGNKFLALIGDALIRLVIVDQGYAEGATTGEQHSKVRSNLN
jgi:ribonuclease-3